MMERLFAIVMTSALLASQTAMASESEFRNDGASKEVTAFSGNLPLPPIPYLDTMPWIGTAAKANTPAIGILSTPGFDVPPIPGNSTFATNNNGGNPEALSSRKPAQ
jgi:hypothetical protein